MNDESESIMPDRGPDQASARFVFVYGTLRAGGSNDIRRYAPAPRLIGNARVRGTLYDLGAYPGLRLDGAGSVAGEVYEIDAALEAALDRLEEVRADGSGEYCRRMIDVALQQQVLHCLVYEIHAGRIAGAAIIHGGDWLARGATVRHA